MHTTPAHATRPSPFRPGLPPSSCHALPSRDTEFVGLQDAYRRSGGLARGESLARRMSLLGPGGYVDLARRIVGGQVFSFQWHQDFWLPLFQFDAAQLVPRDASRRVLSELRGALDGWAVAHWYVRPDASLGERTPLEVLDTDLPAVLAAARRTRAETLAGTWQA